MTEQMEQMIFDEGRRRGREEATKELMEWHNRVCEEMAKRHTADRPMLDDGTLVVTIADAAAVTRVLVEDGQKNGSLYYADRPKGEWIEGKYDLMCSNCENTQGCEEFPYCPYCGADMRGEDNE